MEIQFKNTTRLRDTKNIIITPARAEQIPCARSQQRLQILSFRVGGFQKIITFSFRLFCLLLENPTPTANAPRNYSHLRQRTMSTSKYLHVTRVCGIGQRIRFIRATKYQQIKNTNNTISQKINSWGGGGGELFLIHFTNFFVAGPF